VRVLYCCLGDFVAPPGVMQILRLARALEERGHESLLLVEGDPATAELVPDGTGGVEVDAYRFAGPRVDAATRRRARAFAPDVVHCYEPRTAPVSAAMQLAAAVDRPLFVRFADDDELLRREAGGRGLRGRLGRPAMMLAGLAAPRAWPYVHPVLQRRMLRTAVGYDAITPALAQAVEARYGVDCRAILPPLPPSNGAPSAPTSTGMRERLGLPADARLIVYTGSVFRAHFDDFRLLLEGFGRVAARRDDVVLVHTGRIAERYSEATMRTLAGAGGDRAHFLGFIDARDVEALLHDAAVLVQSGAPTDFNRLRLPAKVHDYLMAGRPVVTFAAGFGELLEHQVDAVLTETGDPGELARAIEWVLEDPQRAERLAAAGRERALELFDPDRIAEETLAYYRTHAAA